MKRYKYITCAEGSLGTPFTLTNKIYDKQSLRLTGQWNGDDRQLQNKDVFADRVNGDNKPLAFNWPVSRRSAPKTTIIIILVIGQPVRWVMT